MCTSPKSLLVKRVVRPLRKVTKILVVSQTINNSITDKYYQHQAIRKVAESLENNHREALLVMATGIGTKRPASSMDCSFFSFFCQFNHLFPFSVSVWRKGHSTRIGCKFNDLILPSYSFAIIASI